MTDFVFDPEQTQGKGGRRPKAAEWKGMLFSGDDMPTTIMMSHQLRLPAQDQVSPNPCIEGVDHLQASPHPGVC